MTTKIFCKKLLIFSITTHLLLSFIWPIPLAFAKTDFNVAAKAAIAVDSESGKIFYEKEADTPLPIASMTKLISLYLILEAIDNNIIAWDEQIEISEHLLTISQNMDLSNILFIEGRTYSVRDLFNASTVISANAAIAALAVKIAGSENQFIDLMRNKVSSWGINDAYLISTSGINNQDAQERHYPGSNPTDENLMSAKGMAIVARHLVKDYPEILEITKLSSILFAPGTDEEALMESTNWMLPELAFAKEGVDGLKTGTTDLAGACFAGTIEQDGWRIITIVMNVDNSIEDNGTRFYETARLMDFVYQNWTYETLYQKGRTIPNLQTIPIEKGTKETLPIVAHNDVTFWIRKDIDLNKVKMTFNSTESTNKNKNITAPVSKGTKLGEATLHLPKDNLGYLNEQKTSLKIPIQADSSIPRANIFVLGGRSVKQFFGNLFS